MNLLLDTQAFLWFEAGDSRLSPIAVRAIKNPLNIKFISLASFWEVAIKDSIGKLELHVPFDDLFDLKGYSHLHISGEHLKVLRNIPLYHRDPFDRLILHKHFMKNLALLVLILILIYTELNVSGSSHVIT